MEWLEMAFGLVIGSTEHLKMATTCHDNVIANSHALQFTTALTNSSYPIVFSSVVW
jgi:hypothetical protein